MEAQEFASQKNIRHPDIERARLRQLGYKSPKLPISWAKMLHEKVRYKAWWRYQYLSYSYDLKSAFLRFSELCIEPLYQSYKGLIVIQDVPAPQSDLFQSLLTERRQRPLPLECQIITTHQELKTVRRQFHPTISVAALHQHLEKSPGQCFIVIGRMHDPNDTEARIIAYATCQTDRLRSPNTAFDMLLPEGTLFVSKFEVVPEYRGIGIYGLVRLKTIEYCHLHKIKKMCLATSAYNKPSLSALQKKLVTRLLPIEQRKWFGGLIQRATPISIIEQFLLD